MVIFEIIMKYVYTIILTLLLVFGFSTQTFTDVSYADNHTEGSDLDTDNDSDLETDNEGSDLTTDNKLRNPLKVESITELLNLILDKIILVAVTLVLPLAIVYSGFLFIKAQGRPDEIKRAKQVLMWTVIGAAVILGAKLIATILAETITSLNT